MTDLDKEYRQPLEAYLLRVGASHDEAQDAIQDTFTKAIQWNVADKDENVQRRWLYVTARHKFIDQIRLKRHSQASLDHKYVTELGKDYWTDDEKWQFEAPDMMDLTLTRYDLERLLNRMPEQYRKVALAKANTENNKEGAQSVGMTLTTYKSTVDRIRRWANAKYN